MFYISNSTTCQYWDCSASVVQFPFHGYLSNFTGLQFLTETTVAGTQSSVYSLVDDNDDTFVAVVTSNDCLPIFIIVSSGDSVGSLVQNQFVNVFAKIIDTGVFDAPSPCNLGPDDQSPCASKSNKIHAVTSVPKPIHSVHT